MIASLTCMSASMLKADSCDLPSLVCFEVDRDLRLDFDWIAIEVVRLVPPLAHSFHRRAGKHRISTEHFRVDDVALFVDGGFDLH